jgi:Mg2+ and Co2+ transporter CorA
LTLHDRSSRTIDDALARVQKTERGDGQGPSFVMHALLDAVVDDYQGIADDLEQRIESIEEAALKIPTYGCSATSMHFGSNYRDSGATSFPANACLHPCSSPRAGS